MNDEEKKAIDCLKEELDDEKNYKGVRGLYGNNEVEIALKLIEKQQKEIEKYKNRYKEESELNIQALNTLKECVHKDKIKEKIKELEKEIEEKNENGLDCTLIYEHEVDTYGIINVLEELLGE